MIGDPVMMEKKAPVRCPRCETPMTGGFAQRCEVCDYDPLGETKAEITQGRRIRLGDGPGYHDPVDHPKHYTSHPSGVECIQITEHMSFTVGNAVKYLWRADLKNGVEDLKKAAWYIQREIDRREAR